MALVGNTFYQDSSLDPGTGYPMYYWHQTNTGLVYIRSASDTGWVLVGDSAQPHLGQLSTQGGNMNGAITGAHGLSPSDINDFGTGLYERGLEVATLDYVNAQVATLNAEIMTSLASALATIPTLNLGSRVAWNTGVWTPTSNGQIFTIPQLQYTDGVYAADADCIEHVAMSYFLIGHSLSGNPTAFITRTAPRIYTANYDQVGAKWSWMIIALRRQN